jgi:hypothetical protein
MAFEFCRDDAIRESYIVIVLALFDCFNTENLRVPQSLTNISSLPMGVTSVNYIYWTIFFRFLYYSWKLEISSGARPALPMGLAPEAIVESFSSIGSSILFSCILVLLLILHNNFVGCAPSAPDSSSPRDYSRKCVFGYRLKDKCSLTAAYYYLLNVLIRRVFYQHR